MDNNKSQFVMFGMLSGLAQTKIELDNNVCGFQREEVERCSKLLLAAIDNDSKLTQLYKNYEKAIDKFHLDIMQQYYKEGFFFGAQLMLEICGYEKKDKASNK